MDVSWWVEVEGRREKSGIIPRSLTWATGWNVVLRRQEQVGGTDGEFFLCSLPDGLTCF
jgi:hypothetical protein